MTRHYGLFAYILVKDKIAPHTAVTVLHSPVVLVFLLVFPVFRFSNTISFTREELIFFFFFVYLYLHMCFFYSHLIFLSVCHCCLCELEAYYNKTNSLYAQAYLAIKALSDSDST